jgi:hypothetical protein
VTQRPATAPIHEDLRPPRARQPRARGRPHGRRRARAGGGRCADVELNPCKRAHKTAIRDAAQEKSSARGRWWSPKLVRVASADNETVISRNDAKPSRGLEPRTPSLPSASAGLQKGSTSQSSSLRSGTCPVKVSRSMHIRSQRSRELAVGKNRIILRERRSGESATTLPWGHVRKGERRGRVAALLRANTSLGYGCSTTSWMT